MELNTIEELIEDLRQGKMVILMDDEDRENEGDLIMVAEQVRAEDINFMTTHARGLVCLTLTPERDRKSTRLNSSHVAISYAVFCLKKKNERSLFICKR